MAHQRIRGVTVKTVAPFSSDCEQIVKLTLGMDLTWPPHSANWTRGISTQPSRTANPVQTTGGFGGKRGFLYIGLITNDFGDGGTNHCGCPLIVMVVRKIVRGGIRFGPL